MNRLLLTIASLIVCSTSYALHQKTSYEVRNNETWVHMTVQMVNQTNADVLFVIDNSGSMYTHQQKLSSEMSLLSNELSIYKNINAAVTTSSMSAQYTPVGHSGQFVGSVLNSSSTPDFTSALAQQVLVGANGDANEAFLDPIVLATSEPLLSTTNAGFLRDDADLFVILITDTEDQSKTHTAESTQAHLVNLKPSNNFNTIYVGANLSDCSGEYPELQDRRGLKDFVSLTQGSTLSLCSDYSKEIPKAFKNLKKSMSAITLNTFPQTRVDFKSIEVSANNQPLVLGDVVKGWVFNSHDNTITVGSDVVTDVTIGNVHIKYKLVAL